MYKKISIIYLIFLYFATPAIAGGGPATEPNIQLKGYVPAPFGIFQKLEVKDYLAIYPREGIDVGGTCSDKEYLQIFFEEEDQTHYFCSKITEDQYEYRRVGYGLWRKKAEDPIYSVYPEDIDEATDEYLVGIGTMEPETKLHIVSEDYTDKITAIRLEENTDDESTWEISANHVLERYKVLSITGGDTPTPDKYKGFFFTTAGSFYLTDDFSKVDNANPTRDPKLNVQRQANALISDLGEVNVSSLAAAFINNTLNNQSVGIGFGVDTETVIQTTKPQQYGGAIVFERTGFNSRGKLHFATRPEEIYPVPGNIPVRMTIDEDGKVGVGTMSPSFQLHLAGDDDAVNNGGIMATGIYGDGPSLNESLSGSVFLWYPRKAAIRAGRVTGEGYWKDNTIGSYSVAFGINNIANADFATIAGGGYNNANAEGANVSGGGNNTAEGEWSSIGGGEGNWSEGKYATVAGGYKNIASGEGAMVPGGQNNAAYGKNSLAAGKNMKISQPGDNTFVWGHSNAEEWFDTPDAFIIYTGNVGIGMKSPSYKLDVNGTVRATNFKTGDDRYIIKKPELDVAELFDTIEEVEVGDLLVIDETKDTTLRKSRTPYEKGVVGIVSESPAILFEGKRTQISPKPEDVKNKIRPPLALAGRVPCKVTNENGPISPGDALTSSSIPGHAMKATDRDKSFLAIIGKALQPFDKGPNGESTGIITVFVNLQ